MPQHHAMLLLAGFAAFLLLLPGMDAQQLPYPRVPGFYPPPRIDLSPYYVGPTWQQRPLTANPTNEPKLPDSGVNADGHLIGDQYQQGVKFMGYRDPYSPDLEHYRVPGSIHTPIPEPEKQPDYNSNNPHYAAYRAYYYAPGWNYGQTTK